MFENGLDSPKAASGKNRGLLALCGSQRRIDCRRGESHLWGFRRPGAESAHGGPGNQSDYHDKGYCATNIGTLHDPSSGMPVLAYSFYCHWMLIDGAWMGDFLRFEASAWVRRRFHGEVRQIELSICIRHHRERK